MERAATITSLFQQGDEQALRLLYDAYYESLLLYAHGITEDVEAAEDVVQECFISFWANKSLPPRADELEKYIYQSVKYASLNYLRGLQRRQNLHKKVNDDLPEFEWMPVENEANDMAVVYAVINRLPPDRRNIFLMVCVEGMQYQEVADALGISKNTVKTQMARSVKFLRENLRHLSFSTLLYLLFKKK